MATTERDYYEVLGVSRTADEAELKRAFRGRARELHPDVSSAPDAEDRFREVVEAYEVLSKPETRTLYDRFGHAGLRTRGVQPGHVDFGDLSDLFSAFFGDDLFGVSRTRRRRGADVEAEVEIELVEAARGARRDVSYTVTAACGTCGGSGLAAGARPAACGACGGAGRLSDVRESPFGQFIRTQTCPSCGGRGETIEDPCPTCSGRGHVLEEHTLDVEIPPGIHDGQRIRITGEGHAGGGGGRSGDIYVRVRVLPDPRFTREGNDIFSTVDLTITQAALGAKASIPTLEGETELDLPPGIQPGTVRRLLGRGMPVLQGHGRGDHRVLVNVLVPRRLTAEQRRLVEDVDRSLGADAYGADDGFFEKLKSAFR